MGGDAVIAKGADSQTQGALSLEKAGRTGAEGDAPSPAPLFQLILLPNHGWTEEQQKLTPSTNKNLQQ